MVAYSETGETWWNQSVSSKTEDQGIKSGQFGSKFFDLFVIFIYINPKPERGASLLFKHSQSGAIWRPQSVCLKCTAKIWNEETFIVSLVPGLHRRILHHVTYSSRLDCNPQHAATAGGRTFGKSPESCLARLGIVPPSQVPPSARPGARWERDSLSNNYGNSIKLEFWSRKSSF